ncbi:SDR family NAD(P)-dependent oxidoreductase [Streptomyces sp. V4-01]|uniref:SDR family NAD(P)-dependent oxidoreductase n=1 Tax=Actinacidiphila polyblastidii TaxID=3110430 RepID=A0ABU7P4R3_9ACTN|nr:SDR family NAD(P)-dependent oxidoreductase [Streptomyces sp. V4-01]
MTDSADRLVEALRLTLKENERLKRHSEELAAAARAPIAIVGMACRLPGGVRTPEELWELLLRRGEAMTPFPADRGWTIDRIEDQDRPGRAFTTGGFLDDAGEFDAALFGINHREALAMDPQQRLLLQTSWEAVERAGIAPSSLRGSRTGTFVGLGFHDYGPRPGDAPQGLEGYIGNGKAGSIASGRIAYALGLEGPALTVDTACSSSLVTLQLAVQALRRGECDLALAGGATVLATPDGLIEMARQRVLSSDGVCRAFGADADGTGISEGVCMLLVERLTDAQRLGHPVLALVRGVAVNQDGRSNGLTAPSGPAQRRVIEAALADAGLDAREVDAVEAHGTGTSLGDPIEARQILATYGRDRAGREPVALGSVKSNLGHTQFAAGAAGVMKMVLAMEHGTLPATLHAEVPSPHIDWSLGSVELVTSTRPWPETGAPRRAAVSSFGISGTNAHVVLEQAPAPAVGEAGGGDADGAVAGKAAGDAAGPAVPWLLSGTDGPALRTQAARLLEHVAARPDADLADVGHTLAYSRSALASRAVVLAADRAGMVERLDALARDLPSPGVVQSSVTPHDGVVFVFPGQGAQWPGMGLRLREESAHFRARFDECAAALRPYTGWDLLPVLRGDPDALPLDRIDVVQPALFAVMTALAEMWRAHGVAPSAVVGHSQGEIAAACFAGALSLDQAARLIALRSKVLRTRSGSGAMASFALPLAEVEELLRPWSDAIGVAAVNGPGSVTVSGLPGAVTELVRRCEADGVRVRLLDGDVASHGPRMEVLHDALAERIGPVTPGAAATAFYSTVDAAPLPGESLDLDYWYANLRHPVRFQDTVRALAADGHGVFVEVNPHPVLGSSIQDTLEDAGAAGTVIGTLRRGQGGLDRFLASAGELWASGTPVDWSPELAGGRRVALPTYGFRRRRYWLESDERPRGAGASADPADGAFWAAVESGDPGELARHLESREEDRAAVAEALTPAVPALSRWRRGRRSAALLERWRYGVGWRAWAPPAAGRVEGTWLLVLPGPEPEVEPEVEPGGRPEVEPGLASGAGSEGGPGAGAAGAAAMAALVARALEERGADVVRVPVGAAAGRDALAAALREALPDGVRPAGVVSLSALAEGPHPDHPVLPLALGDTLTVIQALGDAEIGAPLWCATRGAVAAGPGDPPPDPAQAAVWGLGRTAALEFPHRWGGLLDLPAVPLSGDEEAGVRELVAAVVSGAAAGGPSAAREPDVEPAEDQVAVRPSGALVRRLTRLTAPGADRPAGWRARGTVLVTGGTGAIGPYVLRWLAGHGAERVVCTARADEPSAAFTALRAELAVTGTALTWATCDVADRAALAELVARTEAESGPIRAVIHAAADIRLSPLDVTAADELARVLAGKAGGADHLDALFADRDLDAFVLFSSVSGVWGSGDHGAYAAANAHLDALAERRRGRGLAATSVAWGLWDTPDRWGQDGPPQVVLAATRQGLPLMAPEPSIAALHQAIDRGETCTSVVDVDWDRFLPVFSSARRHPQFGEIPEAERARLGAPESGAGPDGADPDGTRDVAGQWRSRLAGLSAAEREHDVLEVVHATAAAVLGHTDRDEVAVDRPLAQLGVDSLTSVETRNRLNRAFGLRLPPTLVFSHPTVLALTRRVLADLVGDAPAGGSAEPAGAPAPGQLPASAVASVSVSASGPGARSASQDEDAVAIVGIGCRLPGGVRSPEDLWKLLEAGRDVTGGLPEDRDWDVEGVYHPERGRRDTSYTRRGGFLDDPQGFDADFFGIGPDEALAMDPQQRLMLEVVWEALERTGIDPHTLRGSRTGVYVGSRHQGYGAGADVTVDLAAHLGAGQLISVLSGRVSYTLGLQGPAITVDTACSSSVVALHLAAQAVRRGECSLALAGGATVMAQPAELIGLSSLEQLSPDGRCRSFSADADGMGMAEGVTVVVLERLADARRNRHPVLALLRGSAVNHDGAGNGLTAPNGESQRLVIQAALGDAGLSAREVDAVEGHGTGTPLGDSIEAQALLDVYGADRPDGRPLLLGSLKSVIGHTQSAGGVAGVIKMVLAMRHGVLPRTLHADRPSKQVDWPAGGVDLLTEARAWPETGRPRRAGVSSFGISGTNTHVIVEAPPLDEPALGGGESGSAPAPAGQAPDGPRPLVVSARSEAALAAQAARLADHLAALPGLGLDDTAVSLASRTAFEHRAVVLADGHDGALAALRALAAGQPGDAAVTGDGPVPRAGLPVPVFVLGHGGGGGAVGLPDPVQVAELLARSAAFAESMRACHDLLTDLSAGPLLDGTGSGLHPSAAAPHAAFAVQVSMAALWRSLGLADRGGRGTRVAGAGPAADHIAGRLSLADAVRALLAADGAPAREQPADEAPPSGPVLALDALPWADLLRTAAQLWTRGHDVRWSATTPTGARVPLPTYPFQRTRYWLSPVSGRHPAAPQPAGSVRAAE